MLEVRTLHATRSVVHPAKRTAKMMDVGGWKIESS